MKMKHENSLRQASFHVSYSLYIQWYNFRLTDKRPLTCTCLAELLKFSANHYLLNNWTLIVAFSSAGEDSVPWCASGSARNWSRLQLHFVEDSEIQNIRKDIFDIGIFLLIFFLLRCLSFDFTILANISPILRHWSLLSFRKNISRIENFTESCNIELNQIKAKIAETCDGSQIL